MTSTPLGQTGLSISRLGLGLAALGRPGYINLGHAQDLRQDYDRAVMEARAHAVLDAAWQAGVYYFDAARSYGLAEQFLSSWLTAREIAADQVVIGSKWGYTYTAGWQVAAEKHEVKDHSLPVLLRQLGETRALLGAQLDVYQIHSATVESGVLENYPVLEELARQRDAGLVIGLTLTGPNQGETLKRALDVESGGRRVFATVQATWNLLERSVGPALEAAHAAGMGVIVKETLANGRLTSRNDAPGFAAQRQLLEQTAARLRTTVDAVALAGVLARPWVDGVLSGAATVEQLQANLGALRVAWDERAERELEALAEPAGDYWRTRSGLAWN